MTCRFGPRFGTYQFMAETKKPNFAQLRELIDSEGLSALELILPLADEATLIVLGLDGTPAEIEHTLQTKYQVLFAGRCPVLLSCSNAAAGSLAAAHGESQNPDPVLLDHLSDQANGVKE